MKKISKLLLAVNLNGRVVHIHINVYEDVSYKSRI